MCKLILQTKIQKQKSNLKIFVGPRNKGVGPVKKCKIINVGLLPMLRSLE